MTLEQLEHVIRAAASIADDFDIATIVSQAILATDPCAPAVMLRSLAADVWPMNHPERWDVIDGAIGEGSPFHDTFGYYAQGIEERTAVLPSGWREGTDQLASHLRIGRVRRERMAIIRLAPWDRCDPCSYITAP